MSDQATVDFLAAVPLLAGREQDDLSELARVLRRRTVRGGELLWRQGERSHALLLVADGGVAAVLSAAGEREVEIARAGRERWWASSRCSTAACTP